LISPNRKYVARARGMPNSTLMSRNFLG